MKTRPQPNVTGPTADRDHARRLWFLAGGLVLAVAFVFAPTVGHGFVNYDDGDYVLHNPQVNRGVTPAGISWAMTHVHSSNWHPLTWLSHMLDCQAYGLWPAGHHLTNVVIHAINAVLLMLVLNRMTGQTWTSGFVAAVFALHPQRVESVAWISERKDVLSGLFFMLTLATYAAYAAAAQISSWRYLAVAATLAAGLMAKPMLVTLPCVLFLLDLWPLRRLSWPTPIGGDVARIQHNRAASPPAFRAASLRTLVLEKLPLLALSAVSCGVTLMAQQKALMPVAFMPLHNRLANAIVGWASYVCTFVWPANLAVLYPHPGNALPRWKIIAATAVVAACSTVAVRGRHSSPWLFTGWFWYVGMLVPVIGLVQVGQQAVADRFTYLPHIGLAIAVGFGVADWVGNPRLLGPSPAVRRRLAATAAVVVLTAFAAVARHQCGFWRDSVALWSRAVACGGDVTALTQLGAALELTSREDEAVSIYNQVLQRDPENARVHNNLATIFIGRGDLQSARHHVQLAFLGNPDAHSFHTRGLLLAAEGDTSGAIEDLRRATTIDPWSVDCQFALARELAKGGQAGAAADAYRRVLQLDPALIEARINLANILARSGRYDDAIVEFQRVLRQQPANHLAAKNLAMSYEGAGRLPDAILGWRNALRIKPDDIPALCRLAWLLATNSDADVRGAAEAVGLSERAAKIATGDNHVVLSTLAASYAAANRFPEAVQACRRAVDSADRGGNGAAAATYRRHLSRYESGQSLRGDAAGTP